jgi:hypothetical protein
MSLFLFCIPLLHCSFTTSCLISKVVKSSCSNHGEFRISEVLLYIIIYTEKYYVKCMYYPLVSGI